MKAKINIDKDKSNRTNRKHKLIVVERHKAYISQILSQKEHRDFFSSNVIKKSS